MSTTHIKTERWSQGKSLRLTGQTASHQGLGSARPHLKKQVQIDEEQHLMATSDLSLHACTHRHMCTHGHTWDARLHVLTWICMCTCSHGYNLILGTLLYHQHVVYGITESHLSLTCHNLCKRATKRKNSCVTTICDLQGSLPLSLKLFTF